jgi:hypothetical protein
MVCGLGYIDIAGAVDRYSSWIEQGARSGAAIARETELAAGAACDGRDDPWLTVTDP